MVPVFRFIVIAFFNVGLAACTTAPKAPEIAATKPTLVPVVAPAPVTRPAAATPAAPPSTPPNPSGLRPFADIIKDAKQQTGLFTLWTKDDKVWIEIRPEQFNQLYYLQSNLNRGVMGEGAASVSRTMLQANLVSFKKLTNSIQLIARNFTQRTAVVIACWRAFQF
jgi:lipoprotein-anchoring transpeptidase ErfK/SrfK